MQIIAINEKCKNMEQLEFVKGNIITYGMEIFLMQVDSQHFLAGKMQSSESDNSAYRLAITDYFSSGMNF